MGSHGIQLIANGSNYRIDAVTAEQNCGDGISVGNNSLVIDSLARRNAGKGITGNSRNQIRNSIAELNQGSGISQGGSAGRWLVQGSIANGNGASGVELPSGTHLATDSSASNNGQHGIAVGNNSLILRSSVIGNVQRGIDATDSSGIGFITANGNGADIAGSADLIACIVAAGGPFCP
jgi:hypothetical protein